MIRHNTRTAVQGITLSILVVVSLSAATAPFAGSATGAVATDSLTVTDDPVAPDGTITVEGTVNSTGDVTFLIQDPENDNAETVTKSVDSTNFTTTIDLGALGINGELNNGTATLMADEGASFDNAEDTTTFVIDGKRPTVDIDSPTPNENRTEFPTISGTASDENTLDRVELSIQNESDGRYYDPESDTWQDSRTWVTASGTTDWTYDTSGITDDGSYEVIARVYDDAGNKRSYLDGPQAYSDDDTLKVTYTVDTTAPTVSDVNVTERSGDDTVEKGDEVDVSATVTDATAGVDTVTVDSSALHTADSVTLVQSEGDTYVGSFNVTELSTGDGDVSLTVNATDAFGNSETGSDTLTLETAIDSVEKLNVHQQFLGVVEDANSSVVVTATGVTDARGNAIASGPGAATEQATLDIGGTAFTVDVDDGEIDATIDPNEIANSTTTGETTVEITEADAESATDKVTLVHEANALEAGYQIESTPMDATAVEYQYVNSALTYDPESSSWVTPEEKRAGSAYYLNGVNDSARVGYTFAETGELNSRYLDEGYNLIGATPDLNDVDEVGVNSDVGDAFDVSSSNVDIYERDETEPLSEPSGTTDASAFVKNNDAKVGPYEGYYVYVESGEEVRIVEAADYEPSQGS